jgi:ATP-dependent Lon protease
MVGSYPVVLSDQVILPSVTYPLRIQSPASIRAFEVALQTNKTIFLSGISQPDTADPKPSQLFMIGTICRIVEQKSPDINSVEGSVDFIAEGLERASVVKFIEYNGFLSADVMCDPTPDAVTDEKQLKKLDKKVRGLIKELYLLIPKEKDSHWNRRFFSVQDFSISSSVGKLFNVHEITSPSRLADHTAFLLSMLNLIPQEQQRVILETFRADKRIMILHHVLTRAVKNRQIGKLNHLVRYRPELIDEAEIKKTVSSILAKPRGRKPKSTSESVKFDYNRLCKYVLELWGDDGPKQNDVAVRLGYTGDDRGENLRKSLEYHQNKLKRRGHSTHHWAQLCLEIREFANLKK